MSNIRSRRADGIGTVAHHRVTVVSALSCGLLIALPSSEAFRDPWACVHPEVQSRRLQAARRRLGLPGVAPRLSRLARHSLLGEPVVDRSPSGDAHLLVVVVRHWLSVLRLGPIDRFTVSLVGLDLGDVRLRDVVLGGRYLVARRLDHHARGDRRLGG